LHFIEICQVLKYGCFDLIRFFRVSCDEKPSFLGIVFQSPHPHKHTAMKTAVLSTTCLLLLALTLFQFCVKPPDYPDAPVIEFKSISRTTMKQTPLMPTPPDTVLISFTYTDGDGDLGSEDKEANIFVKDLRDSMLPAETFSIPYIKPQGTGNGISGDISVKIFSTSCIYIDAEGNKIQGLDVPVALDTVNYQVWIKDRKGNESNKIDIPPITLICKK